MVLVGLAKWRVKLFFYPPEVLERADPLPVLEPEVRGSRVALGLADQGHVIAHLHGLKKGNCCRVLFHTQSHCYLLLFV